MTKLMRKHYKLNYDLIEKVRILAEFGGPLEHIAAAVGVSYESIRQWLLNAKSNNASQMEIALSAAIDEGRAKGGMRLTNIIAKAADEGSTRDAQWMLTHSPAFRKHYSDAAALNRARQEGVEMAIQALSSANLPTDQERHLLLRITAMTGYQPNSK